MYRFAMSAFSSHRLTVSGHSRGGALATLFGFYAAAGNRVKAHERPVEVISFASPFVGDYRFRKAFKGLERNGKIVHARIVNANDFGKQLPQVCYADYCQVNSNLTCVNDFRNHGTILSSR